MATDLNPELERELKDLLQVVKESGEGILKMLQHTHPGHFVFLENAGKGGVWCAWLGDRWDTKDCCVEVWFKVAARASLKSHWEVLGAKWEAFIRGTGGWQHKKDPNYALFKLAEKAVFKRLENYWPMEKLIKLAKVAFATAEDRFDMNKDLLAFRNGVLDIAANCFRPMRMEDYCSISCGYNFVPQVVGLQVIDKEGNCRVVQESDITDEHKESLATVMVQLGRIFPVQEEREYALRVMASSLSGRAMNTLFVLQTFRESRIYSNGRGTVTDMIRRVLGDYSHRELHHAYLSCKTQDTFPGYYSKKRFAVTRYATALRVSRVRRFTDGQSTLGKVFGTRQLKDVHLHLKLFMECETFPKIIDGYALEDFAQVIPFRSHFGGERWNGDTFVEEPAKYIFRRDSSMREKLCEKEPIHAFCNLLVQFWRELHLRDYDLQSFRPAASEQFRVVSV